MAIPDKYTQKTLKTAKKGDKVSILAFTGMNLGIFEITAANKTQIKVVNKKGAELVFNRKDGAQTNADNPTYANSIVDPVEKAPRAPSKKKAKKKVEEPEPEEVEEEEDEEEAEEPKKAPKKAAKKSSKKKAPEPEPDDEEDDDDEDWDEI